MKFLSTLITTLALVALGTVTMTGCGDDPASVSTEDLLPPSNGLVTILSATQVEISFHGSNNEGDFAGYQLLDAAGTAVIATISMSAAFSGDTAFAPQTINQDSSKTWNIATINDDNEKSTLVPVTFHARGSSSVIVNKYAAGAVDDGVNIDGTVALVDVADGLSTSTYVDNGTADFLMENRAAGGAVMTPMNNACLIYLPTATTLLTQQQITDAKASVSATTTVAAVAGVSGAYVFYNGKSIRINGSPTGTPDRPVAGMCFLIVSATNNIARMVVETVAGTADDAVTYTVYTKSSNPGVLLYKK